MPGVVLDSVLCVAAGGYWTADALVTDIQTYSLDAVAEASVAAISVPPHTCVAGGYVSAGSTPSDP